MITGATKTKVDDVWQKMWEGGITNPIEVINQLTYLMFIRSLDEKEFEAERLETLLDQPQEHIFPQTPEGQQMRWNKFKDLEAEAMLDIVQDKVFPFIKTLNDGTPFAKCMESASFGIPNARTLQKAVSGIETLMVDFDNNIGDLGDLYEYMLSKLSTAGTNGQFRTPKHIRDLMVQLVKPKPGELICDPAMGTAGFLISAAEYLREHDVDGTVKLNEADWKAFSGSKEGKQQFSGFEIDPTMLRISCMNLMLHSIDMPDARYMSALGKSNDITSKYDLILANPPFSGSLDAEDINSNLSAICNTKKTELLFVALFLRMLKNGGRCVCIVPDGVLFGSSNAHKALRKEIVENNKLEAVISMPSGVFKPYSGVSTAVLVFTKTGHGGTNDVWFYDMRADGFSLDDKREEIEQNDIPDIIERYKNLENESSRERTEQSFLVSKQEIADNKYDLSINKYKIVEYVPVEYPPTSEILRDIDELNQKILDETKALHTLLGK